MNVIHHRLPAAAWARLPPAGAGTHCEVDGDVGRVVALVSRCRGHDGFGWRASGRGVIGMLSTAAGRQAVSWTAEQGGVVVGAVGLVGVGLPTAVHWSIPFLFVDPSTRRHGIGTGLVRLALREAAAREADTVTVATRQDWAAADRFWRTLSTRLIGVGPDDAGVVGAGGSG